MLGKVLQDTDGLEDGQIVELLRDALSANAQRVVDLFKEWDDDKDGVVDRDEFHTAMGLLGLEAQPEVVDRLFNVFDPDKSGTIDYQEFVLQLKKRAAEKEATADTHSNKPKHVYYKSAIPTPIRKVPLPCFPRHTRYPHLPRHPPYDPQGALSAAGQDAVDVKRPALPRSLQGTIPTMYPLCTHYMYPLCTHYVPAT